jgi:hypothetical protein
MNQSSIKTISKANIQICVWIFLFVFLSLPFISSDSHAQDQAFIDEHNCHVCPLFEESSSEVIPSSLPFQRLFIKSLQSEIVTLSTICFTCICLSNSDPPINL